MKRTVDIQLIHLGTNRFRACGPSEQVVPHGIQNPRALEIDVDRELLGVKLPGGAIRRVVYIFVSQPERSRLASICEILEFLS